MGYHAVEHSFQPSVTFITTDTKREPVTRLPMIGAHPGCIDGTAPGCSAKALEEAGKEIVRSRMALARLKLKQGTKA